MMNLKQELLLLEIEDFVFLTILYYALQEGWKTKTEEVVKNSSEDSEKGRATFSFVMFDKRERKYNRNCLFKYISLIITCIV